MTVPNLALNSSKKVQAQGIMFDTAEQKVDVVKILFKRLVTEGVRRAID